MRLALVILRTTVCMMIVLCKRATLAATLLRRGWNSKKQVYPILDITKEILTMISAYMLSSEVAFIEFQRGFIGCERGGID